MLGSRDRCRQGLKRRLCSGQRPADPLSLQGRQQRCAKCSWRCRRHALPTRTHSSQQHPTAPRRSTHQGILVGVKVPCLHIPDRLGVPLRRQDCRGGNGAGGEGQSEGPVLSWAHPACVAATAATCSPPARRHLLQPHHRRHVHPPAWLSTKMVMGMWERKKARYRKRRREFILDRWGASGACLTR